MDGIVFEKMPDNPFFKNLVGQKFNMLTVVGYAGRVKKNQFWYCKCDCGGMTRTKTYSLQKGKAKSCGCMVKVWASERFKTHGDSVNDNRPMYLVWRGMKGRCYDENNSSYPHYGGRGIAICERWQDFKNFLSDMGPRPMGMSIDRINNDGHYEPSNCRWADAVTQANNTSKNVFYTIGGERLTISQWAKKSGVPDKVVHARIHRGWSIEDALLPADAPNPKGVRNTREHTPESLKDMVEALERRKMERFP
jgi:hypothetical protein